MPSFAHEFAKSKARPIEYRGNRLWLSFRLDVELGAVLHVKRESTDSRWKQGIVLSCIGGTGKLRMPSGSEISATILWEDTAPEEVEIRIVSTASDEDRVAVRVYNAWDTGDGILQHGHNGAAMIVEEAGDEYVFRCNDGYPDEDFDDIVFAIQVQSSVSR